MKDTLPILAAAVLAGGMLFDAPGAAHAQEVRRPPKVSFEVHRSKEENVEGPDVERTFFMVGDRRVAFGAPSGCRLSVDDSGFTLVPTEPGLEAVIRVNRSPFPVEKDLAENVAAYRDAAAEKIPRGAVEVDPQPATMDPYPYNEWKSLGFSWNYTFYGRPLYRSVSYINLDTGVQVTVTTECARAGTAKAEKLAQQFMRSWWVMKDTAAR